VDYILQTNNYFALDVGMLYELWAILDHSVLMFREKVGW
jgi:hypothetical protein